MSGAIRINRASKTTFSFFPPPPFDFERSAGMHGRFRKNLPDVYENGVYKRVLHVDKKPVLVSVSSKGTVDRPRLTVEIHPRLLTKETKSLRKLLNVMFAPSFDFNGFYSVAKKDRLMHAIVKHLRGLRPVSPPTLFEALIIAITEQQISLDAAISIRSRLVQKYGDRMTLDGGEFYAFPTPAALAETSPKKIRAVGLSMNKARYVSELSNKVAKGELNLEELREMNDECAITELTKIKGVGQWTAEYALIRGMGRVNSLPADDLGIQRAVSRAYFNGKKISSKTVRKALAKFAPYSGIAAFFLMYHLFWEGRD
jgi:DNA-3-methyladenine glycosylase II